MTETRRPPAAFRLEPAPEPAKPRPARAPRALAAPSIEFAPQEPVSAPLVPVEPRRRRGWRWGLVLLSSLLALVSLMAGLAVTRLIEDLFARSAAFGWIGLGVAGLAALAACALILSEVWSLLRLARIDSLKADAALATGLNDRQAGERALAGLAALYAARPDMAWSLQSLDQHRGEVMDPRDRLRLAARHLMAPLDARAERLVARAARQVTLITAVTPLAALDILFVAAQNLRMIRELAALYGGRPSGLATLRLARQVVGHLAVAGGLALSDSLLQHMLGKGLAGRLSARFGEGAVNGILTARIGLAARDVCRPLPLGPEDRRSLASLLREVMRFEDAPGTSEP